MTGYRPFILIVGPTASGKSALGLKLAQHFRGSVLNCDSLQIYKRLDIGTAKPSTADFQAAPHLLFNKIEPPNVLTAADYRLEALKVLEDELKTDLVFGVGGSGFYIQALLKGMYDVPKPNVEVDRQIRKRLNEEGLPVLFAELLRVDPHYAQKLSPNDAYRIVRALVMIADSGKTVSQVQSEFKPNAFPYPLLKFGLSTTRSELEPRVRARTQLMLEMGLVDEVRGLLRDGLRDWPPLQSVGYKECVKHCDGEISEAELSPLIQEKTLQLAKKQRTWFKRDSEIQWLTIEDAFEQSKLKVEELLASLALS